MAEARGRMKIVLISDTHCYEPDIREEGDVLVHAGDFLSAGSRAEAEKAAKWFAGVAKRFNSAVCIAGNHDWSFYHLGLDATQALFSQYGDNIHYLLDSSINIDGKNFYGSPWQPEFCNWAFNVARGAAIKKYWDMIPDAGLVDVLITHGPPRGIGDQASPRHGTEHLGCDDLARQVEISQPFIHVFGHIHGGHSRTIHKNTVHYNASICDEAYRPVNKPWIVELA